MSGIDDDGFAMVLPGDNVYAIHWGNEGTGWKHLRI